MMSHEKLTVLAMAAAVTGILVLAAVVQRERPVHEELRVQWPAEADGIHLPGRVEIASARPNPGPPDSRKTAFEMAGRGIRSEDSRDPRRERQGPLDLIYVAECLTGVQTGSDLESARACVAERLGDLVPRSDRLASWIAGLGEGRLAEAEILTAEVMIRLDPSEVMDYVRRLTLALPAIPGAADRDYSQMILGSVAYGERADAEWYSKLAESLEPGTLFRGGDETIGLSVAHQLAEHGNAGARRLIESGATGLHGGSNRELLRAAHLGMTLQRDGTESIAFLGSILESGSVPGEIGLGGFMAKMLMKPDSWEAGEPRSAFRLLERILDDSRFRLSAARLLRESIEQAPAGVSQATWQELRESEEGRIVWDQLALIIPD